MNTYDEYRRGFKQILEYCDFDFDKASVLTEEYMKYDSANFDKYLKVKYPLFSIGCLFSLSILSIVSLGWLTIFHIESVNVWNTIYILVVCHSCFLRGIFLGRNASGIPEYKSINVKYWLSEYAINELTE